MKYYSSRWLRAKTYAEMAGFYIEGMDSHNPSSPAPKNVKPKRNAVIMDENMDKISSFKPNDSITNGCNDCGLNNLEWQDVEIPPTDIYF